MTRNDHAIKLIHALNPCGADLRRVLLALAGEEPSNSLKVDAPSPARTELEAAAADLCDLLDVPTQTVPCCEAIARVRAALGEGK
jgi:hypothetical protein